MSQKLVEERDLPISAVHPHPKNPRKNLGDLEGLGAQIKAFGGLMEPITVWAHPTLEDDYEVRSGHRRYQASLKAGMTQIRARIIERPENATRALLEEALTTGTNHLALETVERAEAIQGLLDDGASESWISTTYQIDKTEVRPMARLSKQPKVAELLSTGHIDLLGMKALQEAEDETGDNGLMDEVLKDLAASRWKKNASDVTRAIEQKKANAQRQTLRNELVDQGAIELAPEHRYSGKWSKCKEADAAMTAEQHIAAGHQFDLMSPPTVDWWVKQAKAKPKVSPEEQARREKIRHLNGVLGPAQRTREAWVVSKIQDKKGLPDREARALMVDIIFRAANSVSSDAALEVIGKVVSVDLPEPGEGVERWHEAYEDAKKRWEARARKATAQLQLTQLALLLAAVQAASTDREMTKINWYLRDSWEKENRWAPQAVWYQQLIDFVGYLPNEDEVAAIRIGEGGDTPQGSGRRVNDVRLNTATCSSCRQEAVADSKWSGVCDDCAPAMEGIEVV